MAEYKTFIDKVKGTTAGVAIIHDSMQLIYSSIPYVSNRNSPDVRSLPIKNLRFGKNIKNQYLIYGIFYTRTNALQDAEKDHFDLPTRAKENSFTVSHNICV